MKYMVDNFQAPQYVYYVDPSHNWNDVYYSWDENLSYDTSQNWIIPFFDVVKTGGKSV